MHYTRRSRTYSAACCNSDASAMDLRPLALLRGARLSAGFCCCCCCRGCQSVTSSDGEASATKILRVARLEMFGGVGWCWGWWW